MAKRKPRPADLSRRIPRPAQGVTRSEFESYLRSQYLVRLRLLLKRHRIKEADPAKWGILAFMLALKYEVGFQFANETKRRGPRPRRALSLRGLRRARQAQKRETYFQNILHYREVGETELRKRSKRVTDKAAIEAGLRLAFAELGVSKHHWEIRKLRDEWARRLPDAKKK